MIDDLIFKHYEILITNLTQCGCSWMRISIRHESHLNALTCASNHWCAFVQTGNLQGCSSAAGPGPPCWGWCVQTWTELPPRSASGAVPGANLHMWRTWRTRTTDTHSVIVAAAVRSAPHITSFRNKLFSRCRQMKWMPIYQRWHTHTHTPELLIVLLPTWHCWGGSVWRGTVAAAPRWGQGWPAALPRTPLSRCGPGTVCSGGAGRTRAHYRTARTHTDMQRL